MLRQFLTVVLAVMASLGLAPPAFAQTAWQPGPSAAGDDTYQGSVDVPADGAVLPLNQLATFSGWFVDTTAQGWSGADDVQVFIGTMDSGKSLGHGVTGLPRSDVASLLNNPFWSASGWSAQIDPAALGSGQNPVSVYLHTPGKGWWFTQLSVSVANTTGGIAGPPTGGPGPVVTVSAPVEDERISDRLGDYRITGTARDPVAGGRAIDRVQVWLNGEQNTPGAIFLGDADIATDGSFELHFSPSNQTAIASNLYVYAHSDVSNRTTLVLVRIVIVDKPL
jgi:hypothetical protein